MTETILSDREAAAQRNAFRQDVLHGLRQSPKSLPCKWLYDAAGSALYDQITRTPEYYPTRTEVAILEAGADVIAKLAGPNAALVEYGPGATTKTNIVLEALEAPAAYVPIDVSETFLDQISGIVRKDFPDLAIVPVLADFMKPLALPASDLRDSRPIGFFPGSTIGNLDDAQIETFLTNARQTLGKCSLLVIGYDLAKDPELLEAAYDDAGGISARFNLNLLDRINRELDADLIPSAFAHRAVWNPTASQMELYLVSKKDQFATIDGRPFSFSSGEAIHTENSRKFTRAKAEELFGKFGWTPVTTLTDDASMFAVAVLKPTG